MCFSAGASFVSGGILSAAGVATIARVRRPSQRLFSFIPLIFGIQQIAEGFVWIGLQDPGHDVIMRIGMYIYLITALVLWPSMVPGSILMMEESPERKKLLKMILPAGLLLSLYYATCLVIFRVDPEIINCHINYGRSFIPALMLPAFLLYIIVTVPSFFVSSLRGMKWLGLVMFISVLITVIFYVRNVTSVWCFFAGALSILIYLVIRYDNKIMAEGKAT
jgi:hypothetical protein